VNGNGAALSTDNLCKNFGALRVAIDVNFTLPQGCRHALIGPNGSGKTTLINLIGGALAPTSGKILLEGQDITGLSADQRVLRGLTRTFQINTLFPRLTPIEAVTMVVCQRRGYGASLWRSLKRSHEAIDEAYEVLSQLHLAEDCDRPTAHSRTAGSVCSKSRSRSRPGRKCFCSTSLRRVCRNSKAARSSR